MIVQHIFNIKIYINVMRLFVQILLIHQLIYNHTLQFIFQINQLFYLEYNGNKLIILNIMILFIHFYIYLVEINK